MEALMMPRTWERHTCKIGARVSVMISRPGSAGYMAAAWNTYMVSCVPFPPQLCVPGSHERRMLDRKLADAMAFHGWCPSFVAAGISLVWAIRGGPRCPVGIAEAATIIAWLRGEGWGTIGMKQKGRKPCGMPWAVGSRGRRCALPDILRTVFGGIQGWLSCDSQSSGITDARRFAEWEVPFTAFVGTSGMGRPLTSGQKDVRGTADGCPPTARSGPTFALQPLTRRQYIISGYWLMASEKILAGEPPE
jgi:hypothetical protein